MYEYMAMTSGGWGFQWSQWNNEGGQDSMVIRATECSQDHWKILQKDPDPEQVNHLVYVINLLLLLSVKVECLYN